MRGILQIRRRTFSELEFKRLGPKNHIDQKEGIREIRNRMNVTCIQYMADA